MGQNHQRLSLNHSIKDNMYKKLTLVVALLCLCSTVFAQNHDDQWVWPDDNTTDELMVHLEASPIIGGGLAFATDPTLLLADFSGGLYYQFGIGVNGRLAYRMSPEPHGISRLGMGVEVLLSKTNINTGGNPIKMLCLDIPVMVHCYATSDFMIEAGVTMVKSLKTTPDWMQFGQIMLHTGNLRYNDVMLSVGVSYKTPFNLALGLRYNHGTSNIAENLDSKIRNLVFNVSYKLPIIK